MQDRRRGADGEEEQHEAQFRPARSGLGRSGVFRVSLGHVCRRPALDEGHDAVPAVLKAWEAKGIPGFALGRFDAGLPASLVRLNGQEQPLTEPLEDPFWELFFAPL